jgi:hypothetical protein
LALDQCDGGDIAGHNDLTRRIARLTEQYREQVFIEYCIKAEAIESKRIELAHEKAYAKTGVC